MAEDAHRAAETAARTSFGRLVAMLASRTGDIAGAEDALADAFAAALVAWPVRGVPDNPDAWLMTAARRNLGHARARHATAGAGEATLALLQDERDDMLPVPFGDARLQLMYVCTHPAIARDVQVPLMLQTVLGLDAARIARAFLVSPDAMTRQLSRAKAKVKLAGVPFSMPGPAQIRLRSAAVLDAIYAGYGTGWDDVVGSSSRCRGLTGEAIWLAQLVTEWLPDEPEAMGLLALMLHCEARQPARRNVDGKFVPLARQDTRLWSRAMLAEAEALLRAAARFSTSGRFQTEAAIQSLHTQSVLTGADLRVPLIELYDLLISIAPSTGAAVARAVALAEAGNSRAALAQLAALPECETYQPWWVARARVLWLSGDAEEANGAAAQAAALSADPAVRMFLLSGGAFRTTAT